MRFKYQYTYLYAFIPYRKDPVYGECTSVRDAKEQTMKMLAEENPSLHEKFGYQNWYYRKRDNKYIKKTHATVQLPAGAYELQLTINPEEPTP